MNGELTQLVALASAANGVIFGHLHASSFYPSHSAFRHCDSVRFVDMKRRWLLGRRREVTRHKNPNQWLESLGKNGVQRAWLIYTPNSEPDFPDHAATAFANSGGLWELVLSTDTATERWVGRWDWNSADDGQEHGWDVTYGCLDRLGQVKPCPLPNLISTRDRLLAALTASRDFAAERDLTGFTKWFQRAADQLDCSNAITFPEHVNFVGLEYYSPLAQRLFSAAYHGWAFGGMGSWNDVWIEDDTAMRHYDQLRDELYAAIVDAIQQATWAYGDAGPSRLQAPTHD